MANFTITRKSFADALDRMRVIFALDGTEGTIADRLTGTAVCPTEAGSAVGEVAGGGLVKDAVTGGAITAAEALALKTTLGKLVAYWLAAYDA